MSIAEGLLPEFDQEMATTRTLLVRVPSNKGPWKPHEVVPVGAPGATGGDDAGLADADAAESKINLATSPGYSFETTDTLLAAFDRHVRDAREALTSAQDGDFPCCGPSKRVTRCSSPLPEGQWCGCT